ncbi:glycosyltransferase family 4 protein [Vibrio kyushuensis]|uniref:glycosyltransferase family 4 protein n=1 Tax=Vibrio kyushuensis TaxID=2910249 RepID=UPI003D0B87A6
MNPKRLLILSFHYTPDLSACSFRTEALVKHLSEAYPDVEIDLVTTFPSRYVSYCPSCADGSPYPNVNIYRVEVPFIYTGVGFVSEMLSFSYFAAKAKAHVKSRDYDLVFGTSAKLATATLARFLANKKSAKLYLDIRDLFVDNIKDMFPRFFGAVFLPVFKKIEFYTFKDVDRLNIVSDGFLAHVGKYVSDERLRSFTNGIDENFTQLPDRPRYCQSINILYAGNIGRAQSLEKIIPKLASIEGLSINITVVGDGRNAKQLEIILSERNIQNVTLHRPVSRNELIQYYQQADILFLHLDDCECLTRVIPSKVFEYAATGLPMLCGVNGYTKEFIEQNIPNAITFRPNDVDDCVQNFKALSLGITKREEFSYKYSRRKIMQAMTKDIGDVLYS